MIDLNKPVEGVIENNFTPLDEGVYTVELTKFGEWEKRSKNGVDFYMAKYEVTEIESKRIIKENLLLHPNTPWQPGQFIACFLGAGESIAPAEIADTLVGKSGRVFIKIEEYEKETVDKDTGIATSETRESNKIGYFIEKEELDLDLGFLDE